PPQRWFQLSAVGRGRRGPRAQADQVADRKHQVGAVHRVEMQFLDPVVDEIDHLLGADRSRDETPRRRIVLEPIKPVGQPLRHARPGEVRKAEKAGLAKKKLSNRPGRPGADLRLRISISWSSVALCGWRSG